MNDGLIQRIKRAFSHEHELHPIDHELARRWIKARLLAVFPELRENPCALDEAYRALDLEPRTGSPGEQETVFEARFSGRLER